MSQTARLMCVLYDITHLEAGRMGGRHLNEPDGPVDGDVELAEDAENILPPVEDRHLLGQLRQRFVPGQLLNREALVQAFCRRHRY
jgi:hypothetical protein